MKRRDGAATRSSPEAITRLVRSLVGVADARVAAAADGSIDGLAITPAEGATERQVVLNVTSALLAGFGLALDAARVSVLAAGAQPEPVAPPVASPEPAVAPVPSHVLASRKGNGANGKPFANGTHGNHTSKGADVNGTNGKHAAQGAPAQPREAARALPAPKLVPALEAVPIAVRPEPAVPVAARAPRFEGSVVPVAVPARVGRGGRPFGHAGSAALATLESPMPQASSSPRLELVELHRAGDQLRCRVILAVGDERFLAVADAPDLPGAALELPARAATDALRAARVPAAPLQFDGAAAVPVAGRTHVVVSLRLWDGNEFQPVPGVAAVDGPIERAAVLAVLHAVNSAF